MHAHVDLHICIRTCIHVHEHMHAYFPTILTALGIVQAGKCLRHFNNCEL